MKDWKVEDIVSNGKNTIKTEIINGEEVRTSITKSTIIGKRYYKTLETDNGWQKNKCIFDCYNNGKTLLSVTNYNRDGSDEFKIDKPITNPQEFITELENIFTTKITWCDIKDYINNLKERL